jgi:hypothetical protein
VRRALGVAALGIALVVGVGRRADAQANTGEMLQRAIGLYEDLQVERALTLLRQVISPSSPFEVTREQRVQAYKYLGAALTILGQRDSASVYFRAALERDPFVDLDAATFTEQERAAFAAARRLIFAVGARPVRETRFDPRTEHVSFVVITTHPARLRAELRGASGPPLELLDHDNDGVREVTWDGVLADGRLAPPGRYQLLARATSDLSQAVDSARIFFDVTHDAPALEDTLPALGAGDLLPERYSRALARGDVLTALGVAAVTLAIPPVLSSPDVGGGRTLARANVALGPQCNFARRFRFKYRSIRRVTRLKVDVAYPGNVLVNPVSRRYALALRR